MLFCGYVFQNVQFSWQRQDSSRAESILKKMHSPGKQPLTLAWTYTVGSQRGMAKGPTWNNKKVRFQRTYNQGLRQFFSSAILEQYPGTYLPMRSRPDSAIVYRYFQEPLMRLLKGIERTYLVSTKSPSRVRDGA